MSYLVNPSEIESKLKEIWDSLHGTNKMRACLFNLIVYAKKCQQTGYLNHLLQKLIEKFPSRIILVTYDQQSPDDTLRTSVSIMTAKTGNAEIVCDLIEIEIPYKEQEKVPFLVLPHILPDLPIYLLHADDPSHNNPVAEKLEHLADRIIFDSESASHLPIFAQAALKHSERCTADIADLNWARTDGWRHLLATIFHSPQSLKNLNQATHLSICFNAKNTDYVCHTEIQAIYLQAWLATTLSWKLHTYDINKNSHIFTYTNDDRKIEISLIPDTSDAISPGRILSLDIKTANHFQYQFQRKPHCPHHIIIETTTPQLCLLPIHHVFDTYTSEKSLVKEISQKGTSSRYIEMLKMIATFKTPGDSYEK